MIDKGDTILYDTIALVFYVKFLDYKCNMLIFHT